MALELVCHGPLRGHCFSHDTNGLERTVPVPETKADGLTFSIFFPCKSKWTVEVWNGHIKLARTTVVPHSRHIRSAQDLQLELAPP
jgi:Tat protein secretion system quality control protein TatD with DNase activity